MGILYDQLKAALKPGMVIPEEFRLLYDWIESKGFYQDRDGYRVGYLFSPDEFRESITETERLGGTDVDFSTESNVSLARWGIEPELALSRLCVFARTGAEGSMAALWLDDDGRQWIVHSGSGSGSTLCCVLAETPLDFLRLLAIGYDEICWDEQFAYPPNVPVPILEIFVHPNVAFQDWVRATFDATIPETAIDIVKCPARFEHRNSPDPFCRWCEQHRV